LAKPSYVLHALKILGLEEILKLSEILHIKAPLKKAAGEELVSWDDAAQGPKKPEVEAKVLEFPKKVTPTLEEPSEPLPSPTEEESTLLKTEDVLWQRTLATQKGQKLTKLDAFRRYRKATEVYTVKTESADGKDKIRFAETNGVLINKKQA
jgi:hypothetical protein